MTTISALDIHQRMGALQQAARGALASPVAAGGAGGMADFAVMLRDAVRGVSDAQNLAAARSEAYQLGDRGVSVEEVVLQMQRASLAFQGLVAVRNKLVEAYRDVSNLPV